MPLRSRCFRCSRGHRRRQDLLITFDDCGLERSVAVDCERTIHHSSFPSHPLCRSAAGASLRGVGLLQFLTAGSVHAVDEQVAFAGAMAHVAGYYEGSAIAVAG